MRYGGAITAIALVWLLIGVLATWQRGYFTVADTSCGTAGTIALTVIAGPLNYAGVKPGMHCNLPQPSSMPAVHVESLPGMES